jgi:hypothetical protein
LQSRPGMPLFIKMALKAYISVIVVSPLPRSF